MKSVLVFSVNSDQVDELLTAVSSDYQVSVISSPQEFYDYKGSQDVLLLDVEVPEKYATDPLMDRLRKSPHPIILFAAAGDGKSLAQAMDRVGSSSYLIKSGDYPSVLNVLIKKAIDQTMEKLRLHKIIVALKKRVDELEKIAGRKSEAKPSEPEQEVKENILEEIIFVFKRGEIELPAHPKMVQKFREMIEQGAGTQEIALLLKRDMAVSSKLISISNSPYYRGLNNNKTLEQAIGRLGLDTTRKYVEVILHRTLYNTKNKKLVGIMELLWEHSLCCAYASQIIAETLKLDLPDDAFTLGLLHDIGKLVLLQTIGELQLKNKIGDMVETGDMHTTLQAYHGRFGTSLLKLWKYPSGYLQVASYHDALEKADPITKELLVAHFGNLVAKSIGYNMGQQGEVDLASAESYRLLDLKDEAVTEIQNKVQALMDNSKEFFSAGKKSGAPKSAS